MPRKPSPAPDLVAIKPPPEVRTIRHAPPSPPPTSDRVIRWIVPTAPPPLWAHASVVGSPFTICRGHSTAGAVYPVAAGLQRCPECVAGEREMLSRSKPCI